MVAFGESGSLENEPTAPRAGAHHTTAVKTGTLTRRERYAGQNGLEGPGCALRPPSGRHFKSVAAAGGWRLRWRRRRRF